MGHNISGFIARAAELSEVARALQGSRICPLGAGLAFLPLSDAIWHGDDAAAPFDHLHQLTESLAGWAAEQSVNVPIAYIETDYFGGTGSQSAVVWKGNSVALGPVFCGEDDNGKFHASEVGPINAALRFLGVNATRGMDEFETVGLHRYRDNETWLGHASDVSSR
jgi:hypothetical protein